MYRVLKSIDDVYRTGREAGSLSRELSAKLTEGVYGALLRTRLVDNEIFLFKQNKL